MPTKIFKNIPLDIFVGILLKPRRTGRNSAEQWKYITTFEFLLRQADNKHRFESPNITRLARLLFPECWLVAHRTIVGDNGYAIYCRLIPTLKWVRPMDVSHPPSVLRHYCCGIVVSWLKLRMMQVASSGIALSFAESCKNRALSHSSAARRIVPPTLLPARRTPILQVAFAPYVRDCFFAK